MRLGNDATLAAMQRRTLLGLSVAGAAVLGAVGGGVAWLYAPALQDGRLLPVGRTVLAAVARAVLDGNLPTDPKRYAAAIEAHLTRMQSTIETLSPASQSEFGNLLALLAMPPGRLALASLATPWPEASLSDVQDALQSMRTSRLVLRRQGYHALRDLTHAAYFSDPSTWPRLGYPGPRALG